MTIRKTIIVLLASVSFAGLGAAIFFNVNYSSLPTTPDVRAGRIYRMNANRFIVYGTKEEFRRISLAEKCFPYALICGLIAGILNTKYGDFPANEYFPAAKALYRRKPPK